jgi:putative membrane protein
MGMRFNAMNGSSQFSGNLVPWIIATMVIKFVLFFLIMFIIYKIIRKHSFHSISAIRILNERYAKGEIEEEDYLKRKEILKKN